MDFYLISVSILGISFAVKKHNNLGNSNKEKKINWGQLPPTHLLQQGHTYCNNAIPCESIVAIFIQATTVRIVIKKTQKSLKNMNKLEFLLIFNGNLNGAATVLNQIILKSRFWPYRQPNRNFDLKVISPIIAESLTVTKILKQPKKVSSG